MNHECIVKFMLSQNLPRNKIKMYKYKKIK